MRRIIYTLVMAVCISACGPSLQPVTLHAEISIPERLSDWHVVYADGRRLTFNDGVIPYEINMPLFSDYALKLRTAWLPEGKAASWREDGEFEFPVGTILSKTFHYQYGDTGFRKLDAETELARDGSLDLDKHRIVETRLLVRHDDGWKAYPYVWNDAQTEAFLEIAGAAFEFSFDDENFVYIVPDTNQCAACHVPDFTTKEIRPLGPKAPQLNRFFVYVDGAQNQIERWIDTDRLKEPDIPPSRVPRWSERDRADADDVVRAYLDSNCAHCHNPDGPADTSALDLSQNAEMNRAFGVCKPPVAVGRGSGNRPYDIFPGKPEQSILLYRMEHDDPAIMMPELGRAVAHDEAVQLIRVWIANLPGDC